MTGAITLLPLYAFMTWKEKYLFFESVHIGSGACGYRLLFIRGKETGL